MRRAAAADRELAADTACRSSSSTKSMARSTKKRWPRLARSAPESQRMRLTYPKLAEYFVERPVAADELPHALAR